MNTERNVLLLAGPQHYDETRPKTSFMRRGLENIQPLGPAIISSYLKERGFDVHYATLKPGQVSKIEPLLENVGYVFISSRHLDIHMAQQAGDVASVRGKKTIVGGYGPTFEPEKFDHVTSIVRGEFEPVSEKFLDDIQSGKLQPEYDSGKETPFDMKNYRWPDRSIFPKFPGIFEKLQRHPIEWQRGCSNYCSFCSPARLQDGGVRYRDTKDIIQEMEAMRLKEGDSLFAVDLNTSSMPEENLYELFSSLKEKGIRWYTEGTVEPLLNNLERVGPEKTLLNLMSAKDGVGGCYSFLYGADDLASEKVKGSYDKEMKILGEASDVFRKYGIPLNLSLVIGLDNHTFPDTFFKYAEITKELKNPYTFFHIATPYPGTPWGNQVDKEDRVFDTNPLHYNHRRVVFTPKNMSAEELQQGYYWLLRTINNPREISETANVNIDPGLIIKNPTLGVIQSGLPWGIETYLTVLELSTRDHVDPKIQKDLDQDFKNWKSRSV